jgi:hypothetical protein
MSGRCPCSMGQDGEVIFVGRAVPLLPCHEQGCPTFRDFRKVGTTDPDFLFADLHRRLDSA